jgi:hypothetical protein
VKSIRLAVRHTDETIHPMHEFVCESAFVEREVILEGKATDGMETILAYVEGDREAYEAALRSRLDADEYDVTPEADDGFYLYLRSDLREQQRLLLDALGRETVVVVPPMEFRSDWTMRLTLTGHPDDLQATVDALPEGMDPEVLAVGDHAQAFGTALSDRQREALAAAWSLGYYEIPRRNGVERVADELDCAVSTASDLLRRGESRLVAAALGEPR